MAGNIVLMGVSMKKSIMYKKTHFHRPNTLPMNRSFSDGLGFVVTLNSTSSRIFSGDHSESTLSRPREISFQECVIVLLMTIPEAS